MLALARPSPAFRHYGAHYPAKLPADWLMVAEAAGLVLVVPLAPPDSDDASKRRPIGCYVAAEQLAARYREDQ